MVEFPGRPRPGPARAPLRRRPAAGRGGGRNRDGYLSLPSLVLVIFVIAECEDGCRVEGLPCPQDGRREVRLVRRVREVLGLERVTRGLPVGVTADADQVPIKEVAGVELDTRL